MDANYYSDYHRMSLGSLFDNEHSIHDERIITFLNRQRRSVGRSRGSLQQACLF